MIEKHEMALKNRAEEMSIGTYEKISALMEAKVYFTGMKDGEYEFESASDKWVEIFKAAGAPENIEDLLTFEEFQELVVEWCGSKGELKPMAEQIEVNGKVYKASPLWQQGKIPYQDGKLIEKYARQNPKKYVGEMMAVIFKDEDLTKSEHEANAHIKHKANIFRKELTADYATPYLLMVGKKILQAGIKEAEETAKEVEQNEAETSN